MNLRQVLITVVASLSFLGHTYAQPSPSTGREIGLTLEVIFLKGRPPAYLAVGSTSTKGGAWYAMFGRIPGWKLPKDAPPINAVRLVPYLKGEAVTLMSQCSGGVPIKQGRSKTANESEDAAKRTCLLRAVVIKVIRASATLICQLRGIKRRNIITGLEPIVATPRHSRR